MHIVGGLYDSRIIPIKIELKKLWSKYHTCKPSKKIGIMRNIKGLGNQLTKLEYELGYKKKEKTAQFG